MSIEIQMQEAEGWETVARDYDYQDQQTAIHQARKLLLRYEKPMRVVDGGRTIWDSRGTNKILRVELVAGDGDTWTVAVQKQFDAEHGGGTQWFREYGGETVETALEMARRMVAPA